MDCLKSIIIGNSSKGKNLFGIIVLAILIEFLMRVGPPSHINNSSSGYRKKAWGEEM